MPKVISFTPEWLSRPNPVHDIFTGPELKLPPSKPTVTYDGAGASIKRITKPGPRRNLARRGTEIFVAVEKEIRWTDLARQKEAWENLQDMKYSGKEDERSTYSSQSKIAQSQSYRTFKTPVAEDIRQLIISPNESYMAILTTHTVHIAILPESAQLWSPDPDPLRMSSYTLGPTTHVTSQAGIVSVIWHPLGANGSCVLTVTEDAIVRVWELSIGNHGTFDRPTLGIDLKKLVDGTTIDQDFQATESSVSKTFSPDSFEMEVASACFAGKDCGGWSPMTLWIAMRGGDVYALCPLLPTKWSPPASLIFSISESIAAKIAASEDDPLILQREKAIFQQQLVWITEIDEQESFKTENIAEGSTDIILNRPSKPGKIPRLQGPFEIELAPEDTSDEIDELLSDILVIGCHGSHEELGNTYHQNIEKDFDDLSVNVVCLLSSSGRLSICLDLDGVEAEWLPKSVSEVMDSLEEDETPSLLTFEAMDMLMETEIWHGDWPVFSPDVTSRYSLFVTSASTVSFVDLSPWVSRLEAEFEDSSAGSDFRINILAKNRGSIRERLYSQKPISRSLPLSASLLIRTPDLGYFLLTASPHGPMSLIFEEPESILETSRSASQSLDYVSKSQRPQIICEPRPVYVPSHSLEKSHKLPEFLDRLNRSRFKRLLKEEVRLSPATLCVMTEAHKVLSDETYRIGTGAAELFRRCERLQIDLLSHIKKADEVASRVDSVIGLDHADGTFKSRTEAIAERFNAVKSRQKELADRTEKLRQKMAQSISQPLSEREKSWIEEVNKIENKVLGPEERQEQTAKEPWARYENITILAKTLVQQVADLTDHQEKPVPQFRVPADIKKQKLRLVQSALDRETALVEATRERLHRLTANP
ncbi:hypothetical protein BGHDH14_bgh00310 [Blumeria hordei DH14]|uniref:Nuclear pore complex protein An-Nup82 n=1 Tax=Blumeria graminis f. sp. hordei (strain DH14) TaxID=546991 RepID=N1JH58_BLUG1|nr:hypothetical protein BGHDH14_bgh00310 [Blumeria hordei DH14]